MKNIQLILLTLLISGLSFSQSKGINYKALIKDNIGNVVANQSVQVQFSILKGIGLTNVYSENHTPTTNSFGVMAISIGEGTIISGDFPSIDWGSDDHFLNVQIDTGSGLVDLGTTEFKAVPYALSAANVSGLETLDEGNGIGWRLIGNGPANYGNIGLNAVDLSYSLNASDILGATGAYAFAMGPNTKASGLAATAMGQATSAEGYSSTALGFGSIASGDNATAIGNSANASGEDAIAMGNSNATGDGSLSFGFLSSANGRNTIAIGSGLIVEAFNSMSVGNLNIGGGNPVSWIQTDPLFEIGNSTDTANRSNALTVLKNGTITAPTFDMSEIIDDKALITKEYFEANNSGSGTTAINDLIDGKSDNDGTDNGSSLFLGIDAGLNDNATNNQNIGIGYQVLYNNTSGHDNTAMGHNALYNNNTGIQNTAIGSSALLSNTIGINSTAVGHWALLSNTEGNLNNAFGDRALFKNTVGFNNIAIGYQTLFNNIDGSGNLAIGESSGHTNISGDSNIFIGHSSGYLETSSNKLYIENSNADADNALIYGEFDTNILRTNSEFQIGNPAITGFSFPSTDGNANQILQTDGNGTLSWAVNSSSGASGLETIDESNGIGWRLIGRDPNNFGNIGINAIDLSFYSAHPSIPINTIGATGFGSIAFGINTEASGLVSTAMGSFSLASGANSLSFGAGTKAIADNSLAIGVRTEALGIWSSAIGYESIASGSAALAIGSFSTATGDFSSAIGLNTSSTGKDATALGAFTNAEAYSSMALGRFNIGGGNPTNWIGTDPLFEIGNSTDTANRSNALTVLKNGTITAPTFDISEITDNKALITKEYADANYSGGGGGPVPSGLEAIDEGNGIGWRLIGFDPNNYGTIGEDAVDLSRSIDPSTTAGATGRAAVAIGDGAEASGNGSISIGSFSRAIERSTIAIGNSTTSSGISSIAMGWATTASGDYSTALGRSTFATASYATSMGFNTTASGLYATATGHGTTAEGWNSFASGVNSESLGSQSTAMGAGAMALGVSSVSLGHSTIAGAPNTIAVGIYNVGGGDPLLASATDPLFEVGNGNYVDGTNDVRTNALTILRNGNATLAGTLTQNSDRRLKTNITELKYGLNTILKLNPVSYNWKKYPEKTQQSLGLIAQEVQPLIREIVAVGIDKDQTLSLSYIELIPVLIKAMQEQQDLINNQDKQIKNLSAELIQFKELDQRVKLIEASYRSEN